MFQSNALLRWLRPKQTEPSVTWWIEFESGRRSGTYPDESEAWEMAIELRSRPSLLYSRPVSLVSSTGLRFVIPVKLGTADIATRAQTVSRAARASKSGIGVMRGRRYADPRIRHGRL
jgi:hypothetical protein